MNSFLTTKNFFNNNVKTATVSEDESVTGHPFFKSASTNGDEIDYWCPIA